jgi:hypothetical protein
MNGGMSAIGPKQTSGCVGSMSALEVNRTAPAPVTMSAFDPKRTSNVIIVRSRIRNGSARGCRALCGRVPQGLHETAKGSNVTVE